jgi:ribosomal protein S18 acetylase RimI-like enzyme
MNELNSSLKQLLLEYPFKGYQYMGQFGIPSQAIDDFFCESYGNQKSKDFETTVIQSNKTLATALYRHLSFDKDILGMETAKIDYLVAKETSEDKLLKKLLKQFRKENIEYATVRISAKDLSMINALEENNFRTVDGYLILLADLRNERKLKTNPEVTVRNAKESDIQILQEQIADTFIYSRFFKDPYISFEQATQMHKLWIANSVLGKVSEQVLVAEVKGEPAGFMSLEMDEVCNKYLHKKVGHIPLVGTSKSHRGKNIALTLTDYAFRNWFNMKEAEFVRIETQLINIPATRTYENAGFRLVDSGQTLRWKA